MQELNQQDDPQELEACPNCRASWYKWRQYNACPCCGFDEYFTTPTQEELEAKFVYSVSCTRTAS